MLSFVFYLETEYKYWENYRLKTAKTKKSFRRLLIALRTAQHKTSENHLRNLPVQVFPAIRNITYVGEWIKFYSLVILLGQIKDFISTGRSVNLQ
jgi:hypothetical protein